MKTKSPISLMLIISLIIVLLGCGNNEEEGMTEIVETEMPIAEEVTTEKPITLTGVFYDGPVQGLKYETRTLSGMTNEKGEFRYSEGETVTFSVGSFVLGSVRGREAVTAADFVLGVGGDVRKIRNQILTNMARFLQSLDEDANVENGININSVTTQAVEKYKDNRIDFNESEDAFGADPDVEALFEELNANLRTPAQARNHLRRTLYGIRKESNVKIPLREGSYVLADIYRPIEDGNYPIVMSSGSYGKRFGGRGCDCGEADLLANEVAEDRYFEGNPDQLRSEHFETANTLDWVPRGYAVVRVDGRGICNTPGIFEQFSLQEAKDYYDTIEWLAEQPWSNGNVGLFGASYYAMNAYNVAQLQPPHLKAMIPIAGDIDSYRDYIYTGDGLYNTFNRNTVLCCVNGKQCSPGREDCNDCKTVDWIKIAMENPFDDPAIYGPEGSICISPDPDKIIVPFLSGMGLQWGIHLRGSSESYVLAASKHKKLNISTEVGTHYHMYTPEYLDGYYAFFDYWLKGVDNGVMNKPPVEMMVLAGYGSYFWQYEDDWPIPRTQYTKYYLNASPSSYKGSRTERTEFLGMSVIPPSVEASTTYSAQVDYETDPCWSHGVSFITDPLPEDVTLAGYMKLVAWVSSTTTDMQIHASVRVMDEGDNEINYFAGIEPNLSTQRDAIGSGALKVSHRKLDPVKATVYQPYHTNLEADYAPLMPGEIVEAQVAIWPGTAYVKKGWRIRVDVQPESGCANGTRIMDVTDASYQIGAKNSIYTGPDHISYLQLPVIPPR